MLDEKLWDAEAEEKKKALLEKKSKKRDFFDQLRRGDLKTDHLATRENPAGAGRPSILAREDVWKIIHEQVLESGFKPSIIQERLKDQLEIDVSVQTIMNWKVKNVRGVKEKVAIYEREHQLKKMLDTALENQSEVLGISFEDGLKDPRLLAIRQKATEQVLETLGAEYFSKEKEKTAEDKAEQMLRMRLMLQKLIGATDTLPEPEIYDTFATTNAGIGEGDVQNRDGGSSDPNAQPVYDLRTHLQEAAQTSEPDGTHAIR